MLKRAKIKRLVKSGFIEDAAYLDNCKSFAYRPTQKGIDWLMSGDEFKYNWSKA